MIKRSMSRLTTDPWWQAIDDSTHPHYVRASRLDKFTRDLARGARTMMNERRLSYRRRCIEHWQHYLEHGAPPEEA